MKVAIIDSQFNKDSFYKVIHIDIFNDQVLTNTDIYPPPSHCDICLDLITSELINNKNIIFYCLPVLDDKNTTSVEKLKKALKWCIKNNIDVINLSLGTIKYKDIMKLHYILNKVTKKSVVFAAMSNNNKFCYPCCHPQVIGVETQQSESGKIVTVSKKIGVNYSVRYGLNQKLNVLNNYYRITDNSYACAYLCNLYLKRTEI
ncbi:S8 family serine peptidase [Vagococcus fluvialis]|uniref:Peptidase S8/S53 domain-containing protein n=1 Tax=Vagococcus fluvialis bH819 TaxID=1255619 RepID=A0A1X6WRK0_9ENTE|nr:S8 family serine peptidase [Vagococcus fluvialis]SLM86981.1 hypothetical protein FM121_12865 [Vagococcus fluvialis bH819]